MPVKMKMRWMFGAAICAAFTGGAIVDVFAADEKPVAAAKVAAAPVAAAPFRVFPADVSLETSRDYQNLVVMVTRADGVTRDVTAEAKFSVSDPRLAKVDGHAVRPVGDGSGQIAVTFDG